MSEILGLIILFFAALFLLGIASIGDPPDDWPGDAGGTV